MDQDVYLCSLGKQQPRGYFDAKMPAVADNDTDVQGAGCSVRGAGDSVCHVPAKQEAWSAGSGSSSFSRRCTARRSRRRGTGSWSRCSLSLCCCPRPSRARWCSINEWLLRIHSVVGQSVVLAALKQQALKQQQVWSSSSRHFALEGPNNTGICWTIMAYIEYMLSSTYTIL